jgi:hypothetical protein
VISDVSEEPRFSISVVGNGGSRYLRNAGNNMNDPFYLLVLRQTNEFGGIFFSLQSKKALIF